MRISPHKRVHLAQEKQQMDAEKYRLEIEWKHEPLLLQNKWIPAEFTAWLFTIELKIYVFIPHDQTFFSKMTWLINFAALNWHHQGVTVGRRSSLELWRTRNYSPN